jgi:uncharacterized protein (DUF885 family)
MLSRRRPLATAAVTASVHALPKWTFAAYAEAAPNPEAAKLNGLMDTFFQENLQQNPESATLLGLDKGSNANLKARLRDESAAGIAAAKALNAGQLARLKQIEAAKLSGMDRVNSTRSSMSARVAPSSRPSTMAASALAPRPMS